MDVKKSQHLVQFVFGNQKKNFRLFHKVSWNKRHSKTKKQNPQRDKTFPREKKTIFIGHKILCKNTGYKQEKRNEKVFNLKDIVDNIPKKKKHFYHTQRNSQSKYFKNIKVWIPYFAKWSHGRKTKLTCKSRYHHSRKRNPTSKFSRNDQFLKNENEDIMEYLSTDTRVPCLPLILNLVAFYTVDSSNIKSTPWFRKTFDNFVQKFSFQSELFSSRSLFLFNPFHMSTKKKLFPGQRPQRGQRLFPGQSHLTPKTPYHPLPKEVQNYW